MAMFFDDGKCLFNTCDITRGDNGDMAIMGTGTINFYIENALQIMEQAQKNLYGIMGTGTINFDIENAVRYRQRSPYRTAMWYASAYQQEFIRSFQACLQAP